jgi:transposase
MPMVADVVDAVIGGDTHTDTHTMEIAAPSGAPIATLTVENDQAGYAAVIDWIAAHSPGPRLIVGLEGTRSYGIGLARALRAAGLAVVEVERPKRETRRGRGKSDPIDAHLAVLAVLRMPTDRLPTPRADGDREALRILLTARAEMTDTQTRQINQLRALLLTGHDTDRAIARGRVTRDWLERLIRRRGTGTETREQATRRAETRRLAIAIRDTHRDLTHNRDHLTAIITDLAPGLLDRHGVGPVSAAQTIVSWSHPGRCRTEAAFAALAGVNPIPASSGRTTRHRLNRGGDRHLNHALHTIALTRMRSCPRTHAYLTRRRAEGKTDRDIRRILKRYIARELYRALNTNTTT